MTPPEKNHPQEVQRERGRECFFQALCDMVGYSNFDIPAHQRLLFLAAWDWDVLVGGKVAWPWPPSYGRRREGRVRALLV